MSKLPVISGKECRKVLERAGFELKRQRGSHMILMRRDPVALVSVPDHRELDPGTMRAIIRDSGMSIEQFLVFLKG